ncbi:DUF4097 family beta strand repeat protein [Edaphobacter sp. HDX4]|uniref:DUF4097 family beta strand repeat-containing protein n=1 Tax=Edaphobacter sp. HDX4 TaxID=2794064 RepID=UPI002FE548BA
MANQVPPYPPPPPGQYPPPPQGDWRYQRRVMKEQARLQREYLRAQQAAYRAQLRSSRRTSIVGPLLIIATGIVFFFIQTGRMSSRFFWDWYGHWWPALLIGAGIIMLLEWGWDSYFHDGEPHYRRRYLGGGVFTLLLLIGVLGIVFSGFRGGAFSRTFNLSPDNMDEFLGDKHESDQTLSQAFPNGTNLVISNPRGDVTVAGNSDDQQVHIQIHKAVYTRSDSEAEMRAQRLSPKLNMDGSVLRVTLPPLEGARADLSITVPSSAPVTVMANRGDIHVASIKAPVSVTANHGDVSLTAISGPIKTHVNNGDSSVSVHSATGPVDVEGRARDLTFSEVSGPTTISGEFFGTTHLEHIAGEVRFHTSRTDMRFNRLDGESEISSSDISADRAAGPFTLATGNKDVNLDRISGDISVTNRNGAIDLTGAPPMGNITIENRNGSVDLTLPDKATFSVQADTTDGNLENDFGLPEQGKDDSHKSYNGSVGKSGPLVRITTRQGDISIKKASIAPMPPAPPAPPAAISIRDEDGSSVDIGKNGINIRSSDGSSVITDKNGLHISEKPDGSSVYASGGTRLVTGSDGSKAYQGANGTRYTVGADGTKSYSAKDGTSITVTSDGSRRGTDRAGRALSDSEIDRRLNQAQRDADRAAKDRDAASHRK